MKVQSEIKAESILKVSSLTKSVQLEDKTLALLQPTDLTVNNGETIAIVGSSGSGKTTLLSILAGLDLPTSGEVYLKNHALHQLNEEQRSQVRANHVGFIFQQFLLINSLTALENVELITDIARDPMSAKEALATVNLHDRLNHFPAQLSGGEQQRVAIARAIAKRPEVMLCDEPTGALDSETGILVLEALQTVNRTYGTTTIIITHNVAIANVADRVIHFADGRVSSVVNNDNPTPISELRW